MSLLPYVAGAVMAGLAGGAVASVWRPSLWITSHVQHFAAGVVIAAVALELTPGIERIGAPGRLVLGGFAAGGVAMIGVKWLTLSMGASLRHGYRSDRARSRSW